MTEIFVSYRTEDSVHATMAISELLALHFGRSRVFRDQDSLPLGTVYPLRIRRAVQRCTTMLAVIGPHWLAAHDGRGARRIDSPEDWVRMELRMAFQRGIPVVPVLLDDAVMPEADQLPEDIRLLPVSNHWRVRHQTLASDVRALIDRLDAGSAVGTDYAPVRDPVPHRRAR